MRIGILTLHNQVNYGAILQTWALQAALRTMGHDAVVLDHWGDRYNSALRGPLSAGGWKCRLVGCLNWFRNLTYRKICTRHRATRRFVGRYLRLTPYHFCSWKDAPKNLGLDLVVVGSDQVWHGGDWGKPEFYLLEGMPPTRAISYAASFGQSEVAPGLKDAYRMGLARFQSISVREQEGVEIVRSLGFPVFRVVDPTLLVDMSAWQRFKGERSQEDCKKSDRKKVACYFIASKAVPSLADLERWSEQFHLSIEVFVQKPGDFARVPSGLNVKMNVVAGPADFLAAWSSADAVVTDSFHGMMFATIYQRNLRLIRPVEKVRAGMFARIDEFAKSKIEGPVMKDTVEDAFQSIADGIRVSYRYDLIQKERESSQAWLKGAVGV